MFHTLSPAMQQRMAELEEIDRQDRADGTPKDQRMRQVPAETGRFLALLAASAPHGEFLEVGSSGGYSGMWLSLPCAERGTRLVSFDILPNKIALARQTFEVAGVAHLIELIQGDARDYLGNYHQVAFCFLDAEKEVYKDCYDLVVPNLVPGGLLVADNAISHGEALAGMIEAALGDPRLDALVVPIGKGVLVCRKIGKISSV